MMQTFAMKLCPIYSQQRPTQLRPIIEAYNAFNPVNQLMSSSTMVYCTISNLPKAVWRQAEKMVGRTGKDAVKKIGQLGKIGQLKLFGNPLKNAAEYIQGWSVFTLSQIASKADCRIIMMYNNGIVLHGIDLAELEKAVDQVTSGLLIPVKIEMGEIK